jgi:tRNA pseudouridine38-40 synthase
LRPHGLYVFAVTSGEEIRLALTLHYDGSAFFGWQSQRQERTVQGELETAIERLTGARRPVIGSGRTDRGVHATGQVAAVSVPTRWNAQSFRKALNAILPDDVWVRDAQAVAPSFHPRFDAVGRTYVYRLGLDDEARSPFLRRWCWSVRQPLDRGLLEDTAALIVGGHSFAAFAKAGQPERGTRCAVRSTLWEPWNDLGLAFTITADRYLHHMVRYLVGTMVQIASGKRPFADLPALLERGPEPGRETSAPAPARGLFLAAVEYPQKSFAQA